MNTYGKIMAGLACGLLSLSATAAFAQEAPRNQSEAVFKKLMAVSGKVDTFFGEIKIDHGSHLSKPECSAA